MKKTGFALTLIMFFALGIFLRLNNLNRESLALDEAQSVWQASHSIDFIKHYSAQNVHLPLHNILLHYWISLFGTSEVSVRLLSVIPGILILPVIFLLAFEVTGSKYKSLLAFVLASISPFWIWYSREIRMYTLLALLVALSYYAFLKILSTSKFRYFALYTIVSIIGAYTHYFFNLALLVQLVYLFFALRKHWISENREYNLRVISSVLLSWVLTALALSFWVVFYFQNNNGGNLAPSLTTPTKFDLVLSLFNFVLGYQPINVSTTLLSLWPFVVLYGFVFLSKRREIFSPKIFLLFIGVFLPIITVYTVSVYFKPMFLTRYLMASTPFFIILLAWVLVETKGRFGKFVTGLTVVALLLANYIQHYNVDIPEKENYRSALTYVKEKTSQRDVVVVSPPYTYYPVQYYADEQRKIDTLPLWDRSQLNIPDVNDAKIKEDINHIREGHKYVYLVSTLNLKGAQDVLYYMDHNYTRVDQVKFSENVWVSVYQAEYKDKSTENISFQVSL